MLNNITANAAAIKNATNGLLLASSGGYLALRIYSQGGLDIWCLPLLVETAGALRELIGVPGVCQREVDDYAQTAADPAQSIVKRTLSGAGVFAYTAASNLANGSAILLRRP